MIEVSQKELRLTLLRKNILKSAQKRANRRINDKYITSDSRANPS